MARNAHSEALHGAFFHMASVFADPYAIIPLFLAVLPFKHIVADTIAPTHSSRFFGLRLIIGGVVAIVAGLLLRCVLGSKTLLWPRNYGVSLIYGGAAVARLRKGMWRLSSQKRQSQTDPQHMC